MDATIFLPLPDILGTCGQPIRAQLEESLDALSRPEQLAYVLNLVQVGVDTNERVNEVVSEAWNVLESRTLWDVRYPSLEELQRDIRFEDSVRHRLEQHHIVTSRMKAACKGIQRRWGGLLPDLLADLAPPQYTRHVVEMIYRLSKMCTLNRAWELLDNAVQARLQSPKTSKYPWVTQADVSRVVQQLGPVPSTRRRRLSASQSTNANNPELKRPRLISETAQNDSNIGSSNYVLSKTASDCSGASVRSIEHPESAVRTLTSVDEAARAPVSTTDWVYDAQVQDPSPNSFR